MIRFLRWGLLGLVLLIDASGALPARNRATEWAVQLEPGASIHDPDLFPAAWKVKPLRASRGLPGLYLVRLPAGVSPGEDVRPLDHAEGPRVAYAPLPDVRWMEEQVPRQMRPTRRASLPGGWTDPAFPNQWHLMNTGQRGSRTGEDLLPDGAWADGLSGAGIIIGILDDGVNNSLYDLKFSEREELNILFPNEGWDSPYAEHGTAVAGIALARADGGGTIGLAHNAEWANYSILNAKDKSGNTTVTDFDVAECLTLHADQIAIYNNSWGYYDFLGIRFFQLSNTLGNALRQGIRIGRDGLGTIFVWSAGNDGDIGGNANYDGVTASRYTITVGAFGNKGQVSAYSNPGANVLIAAPSNGNTLGVVTTDLPKDKGYSLGDWTETFGGTSAAAPAVSGTVALMLEARPDLTWLDVQAILRETARRVDPENPDWTRNGAGDWIHPRLGFGAVDVTAATRLARQWQTLPAQQATTFTSGELNRSIPDHEPTGIEETQWFQDTLTVQHVSVTLDIDHDHFGELSATLISPAGTESELIVPYISGNLGDNEPLELTSIRHWGESAQGFWTLKIADHDAGTSGVLNDWSITVFGLEDGGTNARPVARDDFREGLDDRFIVNVLENDSDPDGDPLSLLSVSWPNAGSRTYTRDGTIDLVPPEGFGGEIELRYTVTDGNNHAAKGRLIVTVPRPRAGNDTVVVTPGQAIRIHPLDNDYHPDGDPIFISAHRNPKWGTLRMEAGSTFLFHPPDDGAGEAFFTYTVSDETGNEATAGINITMPASRDTALAFNDYDDRVVVADSPGLDFSGPFTVEAWIYPTTYGEFEQGFGRILDKENVLLFLNSHYHYLYKQNSLVFYLNFPGGRSAAMNTRKNSVYLDRWTHVAASYDGKGEMVTYIDGVRMEPLPHFDDPSGPVESTVGFDLILGENREGNRSFQGRMEDWRVWNVVRTDAQIAENKDALLTGREPGLVAWWPVWNGVRNTLVDRSGNGADGLLEGPTWTGGRRAPDRKPLLPSAFGLGHGWRLSDWLGTFYFARDPWLYLPVTGWTYAEDGGEEALWLWLPGPAGWFWTSRAVYPYLYDGSARGWVYLQADDAGDPWIYRYANETWTPLERP